MTTHNVSCGLINQTNYIYSNFVRSDRLMYSSMIKYDILVNIISNTR